MISQPFGFGSGEGVFVKLDGSGGGFVEALEEGGDCGFTGTGGAYYRDAFAGGEGEGQVGEDWVMRA